MGASLDEQILKETVVIIESSELSDSEKKLLVSLVLDTHLRDIKRIETAIKGPVGD